MIVLSGAQTELLVSAIADGFEPETLERRVLRPIGTSWKEISGASDYKSRIFSLVDWAQKIGRVEDLLGFLYVANPYSEQIRKLNEQFGRLPAISDVADKIRALNPPESSNSWVRRLIEIARQVCGVETPDSVGTGFLVGPDQVMTHRSLFARSLPQVSDAIANGGISVVFSGEASTVRYRVIRSPDFLSEQAVVVRLDRDVGRETASDFSSVTGGRARGWIAPSTSVARSAAPQSLVTVHASYKSTGNITTDDAHMAHFEQLKVTMDDFLSSDDGSTLSYRNVTLSGGATGAPCFGATLEFAGLYVSSDNQEYAVSLNAILGEMRKSNIEWNSVSGVERRPEVIGVSSTKVPETFSADVTTDPEASTEPTSLEAIVLNFNPEVFPKQPKDDVWSDATDDPSDPHRWAWAEAAAVTVSFDPAKLTPEDNPPIDARVPVLLESSPVLNSDGRTRWRLSQPVRIRALERLAERGELILMREKSSPDPSDPLDRVFGQFIAGLPPSRVELQDPEKLRAMIQVSGWLERAVSTPITITDLQANLARATLLSPFRHLTQGFFAGRKTELDQLLEYVESPDGANEPPIMIYGSGGMGKSALLAHFILANSERDTTNPKSWRPFVYLDFDRPDLDARDRVSVLLAIARQIGSQVPAVRAQALDLVEIWMRRRSEGRSKEIGQVRARQTRLETRTSDRDIENIMVKTAELFSVAYAAVPSPVVLILDTLEEVQYATPDAVLPLAEMMIRLRTLAPFVRPVLAGRLEIGPDAALQHMQLGPLPNDAAATLLGNHLPPELALKVDLVTRLVQVVGGNPLSLLLAAQTLSREAETPLEDMDEAELWQRVGDAIVQGQLYERIVGHIHDERVKKIAVPGLVLRYLNSRLIQEVLTGPCDVQIEDEDDAKAILNELAKETALVRQGGDGVLVLKPELRRTVLDNFRRDARSTEQRMAIHRAAIAFFSEGASPADRAEEIYHRLWLDQSPSEINTRWLPGIELSLRSAVEELEGRPRIFLASRVGGVDDATVARTASAAEWESYAEKRAADLLRLDSAMAALDILNIRKDRLPTSRLHLIESIARRSLPRADLGGAGRAAESAVSAAHASSDHGELRSALQELAQVRRMQGDVAGTLRALADLGNLGEQLGDDLVLLEANVGSLESIAQPDYAISEVALRVFGRLPDEVIAQAPELARRVAAQVGTEDPGTLRRVIRLVGVGPLSENDAKRLRHVLTDWAKQHPEVESFVPDANASPQQVASSLQYLLENHPLDQTIAEELSEWMRMFVTSKFGQVMAAQ